jgi:hypothetical protein
VTEIRQEAFMKVLRPTLTPGRMAELFVDSTIYAVVEINEGVIAPNLLLDLLPRDHLVRLFQ